MKTQMQSYELKMASSIPAKNLSVSALFICLFVASFITSIESLDTNPGSQEADRIVNLPGQPSSPSVSQFSGYIPVHQDGRVLFYWFFEAQSEPSKKPLLLWLNGGPGCSSVGFGAASELGPLRVNSKGSLDFNNYTWNQEANLLFVESPFGVGYTEDPHSFFNYLDKMDDRFTAEDSYNFLLNWLKRFPQFKTNDFYIAGESYAGHYAPQLAELVYDRNKINGRTSQLINLKGLIVGNPFMDNYYDKIGGLDFALNHSIISRSDYDRARQVCNFKAMTLSDQCLKVLGLVNTMYEKKNIDINYIVGPKCQNNKPTSTNGSLGGYDPCFRTYISAYFDRTDVKSSLHADTTIAWEPCNGPIEDEYIQNVHSTLPVFNKLIKAGLKTWLYSGDEDGKVPAVGTTDGIKSLGLPLKSPWHSWFHLNQVGGSMVEYEGLTFVIVSGSGHLVPRTNPSQALAIIHSFLSGEPLPTTQT